jgi:Fic family protein
VPPISLVLATWREDYVGGLQAFRHNSGTQSEARDHAALPWLRTFAGACLRACRDAERYADAIDALVRDWRQRLGRLRSDAAALRILEHLPGVPLLTVRSAAALIERSEVSTSKAIGQLVDAGVLEQRNVGKRRYRVFQAPAVIELFTSLERSLASPSGETQTAPPVRPVPKR